VSESRSVARYMYMFCLSVDHSVVLLVHYDKIRDDLAVYSQMVFLAYSQSFYPSFTDLRRRSSSDFDKLCCRREAAPL